VAFDFKKRKYQVVVLAAGRSGRVRQAGISLPKVLLPIEGKPLLGHVIDYWQAFASEFIFVVGQQKEPIIDYLNCLKINKSFVEQIKPKGIADAVFRAKGKIKDDFILILGDCFCQGKFDFPAVFDQGLGVWQTNDEKFIKEGYSVEIQNGYLSKVVEKPKYIANNFCGMGFYFFQPKIFDYIKKTPVSDLRNEIEITDVIQKMIDDNEKITPVFFKGNYLNINYPQDIT